MKISFTPVILHVLSLLLFFWPLLDLQLQQPLVFASVEQWYNTILDSGCTNHIIKDHSLFWTYHPSLAVPVKTANCGVLSTLAHGEVHFHVDCGGKFVTMVLKDCLHAPDFPLNLLSVGAMQETRMHLLFSFGVTTIFFPKNSPMHGMSFTADVIHHLSFLCCAFILPTLSCLPSKIPSPSQHIALPTFAQVDPTPELWHHRFGHVSIDATKPLLTKNYATSIVFTGTFSPTHCIPCMIGKHPHALLWLLPVTSRQAYKFDIYSTGASCESLAFCRRCFLICLVGGRDWCFLVFGGSLDAL